MSSLDSEEQGVPKTKDMMRILKTSGRGSGYKSSTLGQGFKKPSYTENEIDQLREDLERASVIGQGALKKNKKLTKKVAKLKNTLAELQKEKEAWNAIKAMNDSVEDLLSEEKTKNSNLYERVEKLSREKAVLNEKVNAQKIVMTNNRELREKVKRMKSKNISLERDKTSLDIQVERLKSDQKKFRANNEELERMEAFHKQQREVIVQLEEKLTKMTSQRDRTEMMKNVSRTEWARENQRLKQLVDQLRVNSEVDLLFKDHLSQYPEIRKVFVAMKGQIRELSESKFLLVQTADELNEMKREFHAFQLKVLSEVNEYVARNTNNEYDEGDEQPEMESEYRVQSQFPKKDNSLGAEIIEQESTYVHNYQAITASPVRGGSSVSIQRPLLDPEKEETREEFVNLFSPECGANDPFLFCGIEKGMAEGQNSACSNVIRVLCFILLLPLVFIPPLFISVVNFFAYYVSKKDNAFRSSHFDANEKWIDRWIGPSCFGNKKVLYSALLTGMFYIPGFIYALVHFFIAMLLFSSCCCESCFKKNEQLLQGVESSGKLEYESV